MVVHIMMAFMQLILVFIISSLAGVQLITASTNDKHQSIYYSHWCKENGKIDGACQYLDDKYCQKVFPSTTNRDFMCPIVFETNEQIVNEGYKPATEINSIVPNTTALKPYLINDDFKITVILIRRNESHHPFYNYLTNDVLNTTNVYQPWSSSKPFAIINAASTIHQKCDCTYHNNESLNDHDDDDHPLFNNDDKCIKTPNAKTLKITQQYMKNVSSFGITKDNNSDINIDINYADISQILISKFANDSNIFGLDSIEYNTGYPLGDLITIIHSYHSDSPINNSFDQINPNYQSNCLAYYFLNIGGRQQLNDNIHTKWLNLNDSNSDSNSSSINKQSLGGNYGCDSENYTLGYQFVSNKNYIYHQNQIQNMSNQSNMTKRCNMNETNFVTISNQLSSLTSAEMYKRIIMTREEPQWSYPNTSWIDVENLLYGANPSIMFPNITFGGASTDTSIYIQSGLNMTNIEYESNGQWRIFSKLGGGCTDKHCDVAYNGYACFPTIDHDQDSVNLGVEFVISAFYSINTSDVCVVDTLFENNIASVVSAIVNGKLY